MKNSIITTIVRVIMNVLIKERKALIFLCLFHIFVIILSNYLVQFPFEISLSSVKFYTTPGSFTFPLIFLATDLTVRVFGATLARKIITFTMLPALAASYIVSMIFYDGIYVGWDTLSQFNFDIFRISLASFTAYAAGQLSDITVFNRLRKNARWWAAPLAGTIAGSALDTYLFFLVAFCGASDPFMAENWFNLGVIDYLTKLAINVTFFLPAYGIILNWVLKRIKTAD